MSTIKSSREIDTAFREARRVKHPLVTLLISATPEGRGPEGRVAFIAGKRLGGAVFRNRSKRVMREAVRRTGGPWPGHDILLLANARTATAPARQLDQAVRELLRRGVGIS